jgi:hypothetical protein
MTTYKPGDIINIVIKGVRVRHQADDGVVTIWDDENRCFSMPPQAAIERVAPPEWPPRLGDLWRDRDGDLWFASTGYGPDDEEYVDLRCVKAKPLQAWGPGSVWTVLGEYGPLTLVRREQEPSHDDEVPW